MAFSTGFGLTCMCFIMLPFLPGQGQCQFTNTEPPNVGQIPLSCCTNTSKGVIKDAVKECYEQKNQHDCGIHAYIFVTTGNKELCVDPDAWWLPNRLQRLKKRGITCQPLRKILHQPK